MKILVLFSRIFYNIKNGEDRQRENTKEVADSKFLMMFLQVMQQAAWLVATHGFGSFAGWLTLFALLSVYLLVSALMVYQECIYTY